MTTTAKPTSSWRDTLKVYPAAELFPLMSPDELRALGEDIKKHGLQSPIVMWTPAESEGGDMYLLDGRNRLDAMELAGLVITRADKNNQCAVRHRVLYGKTDPYAFVISANIHRRHLTAEQKRDLIAKLLKATPEKSNRQIAETVKVDHKTVASVRAEKEATGEIPQLTKTVGKDGKGRQQPARKPATKPPEVSEEVLQQRAAAAERIRALMGRTVREDIGSDSPGEIARKDAAIEGEGNELGAPLRAWDRASDDVRKTFMARIGLVAAERRAEIAGDVGIPAAQGGLSNTTMPVTADPAVVVVNPDGVSVKGCKLIYAPEGQAGEYSPLAANPYKGCGHGCAYCYVPKTTRQARKEFDAGAVLRPNFLDGLTKDARKYRAAGITEQVMLSFSTDVYHPGDTTPTRRTLEILIEHGMGVCVLTKGGTRALRDLDLFRPDRDAFASTLTSLDDRFSKKWERNAALPGDRIAALRAYHERGIFTWVSLEPMLDVESSLAIVEATHRFVDLYKVGRANYLKEITRTTDWKSYTLRMIELLNQLGAKHYIKKDLQPYLPAGYPNPLRVPQHHGKGEP